MLCKLFVETYSCSAASLKFDMVGYTKDYEYIWINVIFRKETLYAILKSKNTYLPSNFSTAELSHMFILDSCIKPRGRRFGLKMIGYCSSSSLLQFNSNKGILRKKKWFTWMCALASVHVFVHLLYTCATLGNSGRHAVPFVTLHPDNIYATHNRAKGVLYIESNQMLLCASSCVLDFTKSNRYKSFHMAGYNIVLQPPACTIFLAPFRWKGNKHHLIGHLTNKRTSSCPKPL